MSKPITVPEYLTHVIEASGKTQREIANEVGWPKANMITMVKQGVTKVPVDKVPALAKAVGVDTAHFMSIVMREYYPELWAAIRNNLGEVLTADEKKVLEDYRKTKENV